MNEFRVGKFNILGMFVIDKSLDKRRYWNIGQLQDAGCRMHDPWSEARCPEMFGG